MGTILDIVGSLAIRAVIILVVIGLTITLRNALYQKTSRTTTSQVLANAASVMEKDMRLAGYNSAAWPFIGGDSTQMTFLADLNNVGNVDTVQYLLTRDPNDTDPDSQVRLLSRVVDGQTSTTLAKGVMTLHFTYLDSVGASTLNLTNVQSIAVDLSLLDPYPPDSSYAIVRREFRVFPGNL